MPSVDWARALRVNGRAEEALTHLDSAQAVAEDEGLKKAPAMIHGLRGNLYFPLVQLEQCIKEHEQARRYANRPSPSKPISTPANQLRALSCVVIACRNVTPHSRGCAFRINGDLEHRAAVPAPGT